MTALEWRYKRRDDSGQIVQEDWRPRPEGLDMYQLWDEAAAVHADIQGVESRPAQAAST